MRSINSYIDQLIYQKNTSSLFSVTTTLVFATFTLHYLLVHLGYAILPRLYGFLWYTRAIVDTMLFPYIILPVVWWLIEWQTIERVLKNDDLRVTLSIERIALVSALKAKILLLIGFLSEGLFYWSLFLIYLGRTELRFWSYLMKNLCTEGVYYTRILMITSCLWAFPRFLIVGAITFFVIWSAILNLNIRVDQHNLLGVWGMRHCITLALLPTLAYYIFKLKTHIARKRSLIESKC